MLQSEVWAGFKDLIFIASNLVMGCHKSSFDVLFGDFLSCGISVSALDLGNQFQQFVVIDIFQLKNINHNKLLKLIAQIQRRDRNAAAQKVSKQDIETAFVAAHHKI